MAHNTIFLYLIGPPTPFIAINSSNVATDVQVCFNARYKQTINVTDVTGELTPLSRSYNAPDCLSLNSDDVCSPFLVSVAATNEFGSLEANRSIEMEGNVDLFTTAT